MIRNILIRFSEIKKKNRLDRMNYVFVFVGFIGLHCEKPCSAGYYGYNCTKKCDCLNDEYCNPRNGECPCRPGYEGPKCENQCKVKLAPFLFQSFFSNLLKTLLLVQPLTFDFH